MSSSVIDNLILPENLIRDIQVVNTDNAAYILDIGQLMAAVGLDLFIRNRGAAALTIAVNGAGPITVDAGDVYEENNSKFWLVTITSAVLYDFKAFGVKYSTLKRRGLM